MGSPPQARAPPPALFTMVSRTLVSLSLLALLLALLVATPLAQAGRTGKMIPPSHSGEDRDDHYDDDWTTCCAECDKPPDRLPPDCDKDACDRCCHPSNMQSHLYCKPELQSPFYLVAQIVLGAALVVAIAALISVVLRTCSRRRARSGQQRPQFRPSAGSSTSLDVYVRERLHDCPPCYDEISWEKPPSYDNLQTLEFQERTANGSERREPPSSPTDVPHLSEPPGPSLPPTYSGIFVISEHVQQQESQTESDCTQNASAAGPAEVVEKEEVPQTAPTGRAR